MKKMISSFLAHFPTVFAGRAFSMALLLILSCPDRLLAQKKVVVADLNMPVAGTTYATDFEKRNEGKKYPWLYFNYGFQEGDVLDLDIARNAGKATYDLEVKEYGTDQVVFSRKNFAKLRNVKLTVPKRTMYTFTVKSNHPEPSAIDFKLTRRPASAAGGNFNSQVSWKVEYDSVFTMKEARVQVSSELKPQVLTDKMYRVPAEGKTGKDNRIVIPFQVPENASHWVYWLGVGKESVQDLKELAKTIPQTGTAGQTTTDPVMAFGLNLIPQLPPVKASGFIDFLFMDQASVKPFLTENIRKPFKFASGNAIINAYGKIMTTQTPKTDDQKLYLGIANNNSITSLEVSVKIIAFIPEPKFETRQVKTLSHLEEKRVPVYGQ